MFLVCFLLMCDVLQTWWDFTRDLYSLMIYCSNFFMTNFEKCILLDQLRHLLETYGLRLEQDPGWEFDFFFMNFKDDCFSHVISCFILINEEFGSLFFLFLVYSNLHVVFLRGDHHVYFKLMKDRWVLCQTRYTWFLLVCFHFALFFPSPG